MSNQFQDIESEKAILGAVLLDYDRVLNLMNSKGFTADMLELSQHKVIFHTMESMHKAGKCIDVMTLEHRLVEKHNFEHAGGVGYCNMLLDSIPTMTHAEHYLDAVIEKYRLRMLRDCYYEITQKIENGESSGEIISGLMSSLSRHIDQEPAKNPSSLHEQSLKEAEDAQMQGRPAGLPSFLSTLSDTMGNYLPETMYVVAGRPSDGKTSLATCEAIHKAVILRVPTAFVSMEMGEKLLREQMAGLMANVSSFSFRRGMYSAEQRKRMVEAFRLLQNSPLFINDSRMTVEQVISWLSNMVAKNGVRFGVLDYIQLMKSSKGRGGVGRVEQVMDWSGELKGFSKKAGIPMMVLSQLSRQGIKLESATPAAPTLESLRDSGAIEQDADTIIFTYKKPGEPLEKFYSDFDWPMELSVSKNRNGPIGRVPVIFVRSRQRFVGGEGEELDWTRQMRKEDRQAELSS